MNDEQPTSLTASAAPWQRHFDKLWNEAGVAPADRPVVSQMGGPLQIESRRWTAYSVSTLYPH